MSKENRQRAQERSFNWKLLPLQFILMVFPLIMHLYSGESGYGAYAWCSDDHSFVDVFLYGKMIVFEIVAVVMLGILIYCMVKMNAERRKQALRRFVPLFVYGGLVILSTICSENIEDSVAGAMSAWEPVGVLLGYVVAAIYAYVVVETTEDVRQLLGATVVGAGCMSVVGILQVAGKDPLLNETLQRLIIGAEDYDYGIRLKGMFTEGTAYVTLFNPNYVGTYVAMYLPLVVVGMFLFQKTWKKIVSAVMVLGLLIVLFASQSRTGIFSVIALAVAVVIFLQRKIFKYWYLLIPGVTLVIFSFRLFDTWQDNRLTNRIRDVFVIEPHGDPVLGVDTTGNGVRVVTQNTEYVVLMSVDSTGFYYVALEGKEQREVFYNDDKSYGYFTLSDGTQVEIQTAVFDSGYAFGLNINGKQMYFTNQQVVGNYKYINTIGKLDECVMAANVFPGYEDIASGRGYVWGRTIPLLTKYWLVGSGPDTFALTFPQNDYVARNRGHENVIFTRPHNLYLQIGVQTGTVSLIAFLVFYVMYFAGSCRRYLFCRYTRKEEWMGLVLWFSTIGFMIAGFANDSLVVVTPMFYVILGTGSMVNQVLCPVEKRNKEEEVEEIAEEDIVEEKGME